MDIIELHERAADQTGQIVAGIRQDQLDLPTPCTEWDVRALLNHLIGGNQRWAAVAEGAPMRRGAPGDDYLGGDPAEAYRQSAETLKQAWRQPGRLERSYELPIGTLPGPAAVSIHLVELVTHGWDLAKATGQTPHYDDDVVQVALTAAERGLRGDRPPGFPFAPAVEVGEEAPAVDRLAALAGRQVPDWA